MAKKAKKVSKTKPIKRKPQKIERLVHEDKVEYRKADGWKIVGGKIDKDKQLGPELVLMEKYV